jgi:hypothetical protein
MPVSASVQRHTTSQPDRRRPLAIDGPHRRQVCHRLMTRRHLPRQQPAHQRYGTIGFVAEAQASSALAKDECSRASDDSRAGSADQYVPFRRRAVVSTRHRQGALGCRARTSGATRRCPQPSLFRRQRALARAVPEPERECDSIPRGGRAQPGRMARFASRGRPIRPPLLRCGAVMGWHRAAPQA